MKKNWLALLPVTLTAAVETALYGRFLTISDLHPDWNYKINTSVSESCHAGKPAGKRDRAGIYGAPVSDCDSPPALIDLLFDELKHRWTQVDFVIVMGDLARHDLDPNIPRSLTEIVSLNQNISYRLQETFGDKIPIIPSIGNNDVFPHNILQAGPSRILASIQSVWNDYIPEEQYHTFARGGYYATEVIPNKLVVVALNTLFWFNSNKLMNGCPTTKRHSQVDPGTEHLNWLQAQLKQWRQRGLQVILSGHVPPSDYWPDCYLKFAEIVLAYQDTIIASIFGHKNVDHFTLFSASELFSPMLDSSHALALVDDLRSIYSNVPSNPAESNYAVMNYAPSVIPTYLPAYRIWTYNTSDASSFVQSSNVSEEEDFASEQAAADSVRPATESSFSFIIQSWANRFTASNTLEYLTRKKQKKHKKKKKKGPRPSLPRHTSPDSPSRSNTFLSLLGYEQYFLDLEKANTMNTTPAFELEYVTYSRSRLAEKIFYDNHSAIQQLDTAEVQSLASVESVLGQKHSNLTPYGMQDLTLKEWLKLAHRLSTDDKLWEGFRQRIFVSSGA